MSDYYGRNRIQKSQKKHDVMDTDKKWTDEDMLLLMAQIRREVYASHEDTAHLVSEAMAPITKLIEQRDGLLMAAKKVMPFMRMVSFSKLGFDDKQSWAIAMSELNEAIKKAGAR